MQLPRRDTTRVELERFVDHRRPSELSMLAALGQLQPPRTVRQLCPFAASRAQAAPRGSGRDRRHRLPAEMVRLAASSAASVGPERKFARPERNLLDFMSEGPMERVNAMAPAPVGAHRLGSQPDAKMLAEVEPTFAARPIG
jgi:hypothetical protein